MDQDELRDFRKAPLRSRLEAFLLDHAEGAEPEEVTAWKREVLGSLRGTVVEIGPGPGPNLRFYAPGVHVVAVEPNPAMHPRLRAAAERDDVQMTIDTVHAEVMGQVVGQAGTADAVVGTLVLCGVDDVGAVLAQVHRVLRPGGTYVFYEHVRAPEGSGVRTAQRIVKRPQRWLFNGCEVDRDTASAIREVFPSASVEPVDAGLAAGWTRTRVMGTATR